MRRAPLALLALAAVLAGGATRIVQDQCGPFTDVTPGLCPYILEIYYLGVTVGTSATTFSPDAPLTRGQGAVFVAKGINQTLARSSRRAALGRWWTTGAEPILGVTFLGARPIGVASDGADLWVANIDSGTISRVRASDGRVLATWTLATNPTGVLVAMGRVFVTGQSNPGKLYMIDPTQPATGVTAVATGLGDSPAAIAFDGTRIWTANSGGFSGTASVSIVVPAASAPWPVTNVEIAASTLSGIVFDGKDVWVSSFGAGAVLRLDANGQVAQTVPDEGNPTGIVYDGANLWVPNANARIDVFRAADGTPLASLTQPDMLFALAAAFDGERVAVVDFHERVFLWRAADFTPLGSTPLAPTQHPNGICSDGIDFWITAGDNVGQLIRF
jgi:DNA-binding beta-propeller fold protein YncE